MDIKEIAKSPIVDELDGFDEIEYYFKLKDDALKTPELLEKPREALYKKILKIYEDQEEFTFGGGGIDLVNLYPSSEKFEYKFICWVK